MNINTEKERLQKAVEAKGLGYNLLMINNTIDNRPTEKERLKMATAWADRAEKDTNL